MTELPRLPLCLSFHICEVAIYFITIKVSPGVTALKACSLAYELRCLKSLREDLRPVPPINAFHGPSASLPSCARRQW